MGVWKGCDCVWKLPWRRSLFNWEVELVNSLMQDLGSNQPDWNNEDGVKWNLSIDGKYSVKSFLDKAYNETYPVIMVLGYG